MNRNLGETKLGKLINQQEASLVEKNRQSNASLKLTASHGSVRFTAEVLESVDQLIAEAGRVLHIRKRQKHTLTQLIYFHSSAKNIRVSVTCKSVMANGFG